MSIALDLALFLREQKTLKPLTLTERGLLFTLFFRVGSNPNTWVSQETLAMELDINDRNVRRLLGQIHKKGYLEKEKNHKNKSKNSYRPAEFLINYHQQINRNPTKKYRTKLTPINKNTGQNYPVLEANTGQNYPVNTGQNYPVSSNDKTLGSPASTTFPEVEKSPKVKGKATTSKVKAESLTLPDYFYPNEEAKAAAQERGLVLRDIFKSFKDWTIKDSIKSTNWDKAFMTWIDTEKGSKSKLAKKQTVKNESCFSDVGKQSTTYVSMEESMRRDREYQNKSNIN